MQRFRVDDVKQAKELLPTRPLHSLYPGALAIGGDPQLAVIDHGQTHPLLAAVSIAFAQHRPLVLTPDSIWLTIAQGMAQHVRLHAEELRPRLVSHDGKQRLELLTGRVPAGREDWAAAIAGLRSLLGAKIGHGRASLFECNFSTSSADDLIASQVVLLDAYSPYFAYALTAICGIPSITLTGTVEDWKAIRERIEVVSEFGLAAWCRSLRPIADQFVRAAGGGEDTAFWRRIYNPIDAYGGDLITGWITRLYPYVEAGGAVNHPNPMLELPLDEPKLRTKSNKDPYRGPGLRSSQVPAAISRAHLKVANRQQGTTEHIDLVAGVGAIAQDGDGALRPITTWRIEKGSIPIEDVLDRIAKEHQAELVEPGTRQRITGTADEIAFYTRFERATLFQGAWRIRGCQERTRIEVDRVPRLASVFADLGDGTKLCVSEEQWFICRVEEEPDEDTAVRARPGRRRWLQSKGELRLLSGSLASILSIALDHGGKISTLPTGHQRAGAEQL